MKPHYEVVAAVIEKDGLFFCTQRGPGGDCAFRWEFPGGKIEPGETKENALIREISEELDVNVSVEHFIDKSYYEYPHFTLNLYAFLCKMDSKSITLKEHNAAKWLKKEELLSLDWAPADLPIIHKIKEQA